MSLMRLSVLSRYLVREAGLAWLAVTFILVAVLVTNQLARLLGEAASGRLPAKEVFSLLGLALLANLHIVLPASFFLGAALAFGRLYRDSEMAALSACGVGPRELYRALFKLAIPLALLTGWLSLSVGPWAQRQVGEVRARAAQAVEAEALRPGRFITSGRAEGMFYVESLDSALNLGNVFAQGVSKGRLVLVSAQRGRQERDPNTGERFLVLENGYRYEGVPGTANWRLVEFKEHGVRIPEAPAGSGQTRRRGVPLLFLWASQAPGDLAEIQWRFSTPLMVLLLTFIVVPLSKSQPREGRYGKVLSAVLVFAIYSNLLSIAQEMTASGKIPVWPGLGWVHLLAGVFGVVWLARRFGPLRASLAARPS